MSSGESGGRYRRRFEPGNDQWKQVSLYVRFGAIGLLVLVVIFLAASTVYRIEASDEGVVLRFGEQRKTVPPGLHWKLPWPIDTVYDVPVQRVQTLEFGFETTEPGRVTQFAPTSTDDLAVPSRAVERPTSSASCEIFGRKATKRKD